MPIAATFLFGLALWSLSELFVFVLVCEAIGLGGALLATLLTSFVGALLLRRLGRAARQELRVALAGGTLRLAPSSLESGVLAALGALLLLLPGFLSDCVGLFLLAASLRRPAPAPAKKAGVIDLAPQDWQRVEERDRN